MSEQNGMFHGGDKYNGYGMGFGFGGESSDHSGSGSGGGGRRNNDRNPHDLREYEKISVNKILL